MGKIIANELILLKYIMNNRPTKFLIFLILLQILFHFCLFLILFLIVKFFVYTLWSSGSLLYCFLNTKVERYSSSMMCDHLILGMTTYHCCKVSGKYLISSITSHVLTWLFLRCRLKESFITQQ